MSYEKQNVSTFGQANKMSMNFGRSVQCSCYQLKWKEISYL